MAAFSPCFGGDSNASHASASDRLTVATKFKKSAVPEIVSRCIAFAALDSIDFYYGNRMRTISVSLMQPASFKGTIGVAHVEKVVCHGSEILLS